MKISSIIKIINEYDTILNEWEKEIQEDKSNYMAIA